MLAAAKVSSAPRSRVRRAQTPAPLLPGAALAALALALLLAPRAAAIAAEARHAMVVAESEPAAKAGLKILQSGGNAVDAACAAALAMCVTNASSCGIGGGGFMLVYIARTGFYGGAGRRARRRCAGARARATNQSGDSIRWRGRSARAPMAGTVARPTGDQGGIVSD